MAKKLEAKKEAVTYTVSNRTLLKSLSGLQEIGRLPLRVKISFALGKIFSEIQKQLDVYNSESAKLLDRHTKKDSSGAKINSAGGGVEIADPAAYKDDINELLDIPVEITLRPIRLSDLGDNKITVGTMTDLGWLLEDDL